MYNYFYLFHLKLKIAYKMNKKIVFNDHIKVNGYSEQ